jgi:exonuclease SbcD
VRLLAFGDVHLGAGADYGAAPGDRLRDQDRLLQAIAAAAGEEDVAAVLFAGDAFERRSPTPAELMVWKRFARQLRDREIPMFSITGNHDVAAAELPTALEVIGSAGRTPMLVNLAGPYGLAVLPWTPPSRLVAAAGGGDRDLIHERAAELLLQTAGELRRAWQGSCILLAHWSVSGASLPNGLPTDELREPVLELGELEGLGFDYVVLGHIHKPQALDPLSSIFYVGSPLPLNFGEAETSHGYWLLDTEAATPEFVPLPSREFITLQADLTDSETFDVGELSLGRDAAIADAVVRIRYRATEEQARRVDHAALRAGVAQAGAHKLYAIQPDIVRAGRARVEGATETMGEEEAVMLWLGSQELEPAQEAAVLSRHARYVEGLR